MFMTEIIEGIKSSFEIALEQIKKVVAGIEESEKQKLLTRLESMRSALIRNEKKIWLRTKKGRDMILELNEATGRIIAALDMPINLSGLDDAINEAETYTRALDEETRKRSMVVT